VTISANPPLSGLICVDKQITFTCHVNNVDRVLQYQWSINEGAPKIGDQTYTMIIHSQSVINVTCEVYVQVNSTTSFGSNSVIVHPTGEPKFLHKTIDEGYIMDIVIFCNNL